ncbi:hypothetical protein [Stenotrophomonas pavanii]|uniref:hypothetical protein n=1 Tax=Stenotrophomonas pavanii TaxID=487698 RepID=UPI002478B62A|nr:hypothetical protein [Stenotrophomonas pavanii]
MIRLELMQLRQHDDGRLLLTALSSGQNTTDVNAIRGAMDALLGGFHYPGERRMQPAFPGGLLGRDDRALPRLPERNADNRCGAVQGHAASMERSTPDRQCPAAVQRAQGSAGIYARRHSRMEWPRCPPCFDVFLPSACCLG